MEFLKGLLSKKLIVTIAGSIYFLASGDVNQAVALILGYIGVQGTIDVMKVLKK